MTTKTLADGLCGLLITILLGILGGCSSNQTPLQAGYEQGLKGYPWGFQLPGNGTDAYLFGYGYAAEDELAEYVEGYQVGRIERNHLDLLEQQKR